MSSIMRIGLLRKIKDKIKLLEIYDKKNVTKDRDVTKKS